MLLKKGISIVCTLIKKICSVSKDSDRGVQINISLVKLKTWFNNFLCVLTKIFLRHSNFSFDQQNIYFNFTARIFDVSIDFFYQCTSQKEVYYACNYHHCKGMHICSRNFYLKEKLVGTKTLMTLYDIATMQILQFC